MLKATCRVNMGWAKFPRAPTIVVLKPGLRERLMPPAADYMEFA